MLTWHELESACRECKNCPLHAERQNMVFGVGNREAKLMFIGEGPGEQEDIQGIPFVGPAGMLLTDYLTAVGIKRDEVYIANIVKCRPPRNRDPHENEQEACIGYLRNQVQLIKPRIIVLLGRIAAQKIIDPEFRITKEHGVWHESKGFRMIATYHPSALLRDESKKPEAFMDFKKIAEEYRKLV